MSDMRPQNVAQFCRRISEYRLNQATVSASISTASRGHMFPQLYRFTDLALLLLRLMIGIVFLSSGWSHVKSPDERSKSIGMSKGFTVFLGLEIGRASCRERV